MTATIPEVLYANDTDVYRDYELAGDDLDFTPVVTINGTAIATPEWQGATADGKRVLRVHYRAADGSALAATNHHPRLVVPGGNDVYLGTVTLS